MAEPVPNDNEQGGGGNVSIEEITNKIKSTIQSDYERKFSEVKTQAQKEAEAKVSALYDQMAENLGYEGRFNGVEEIVEYVNSQRGSGDIDVKQTREYSSLKSQLQETLQKAEEYRTKYESTISEFEQKERDRSLNEALRNSYEEIAKDYQLSAEDALLLYRNKRKLDVSDNGIAVRDASGNPLFSPSGTERGVVEDMREVFKSYAKAPSGAGGRTGDANSAASKGRSKMSPSEIDAFVEANGLEAYLKLPE